MRGEQKWYADATLVRSLPLRYRAYAFYSRVAGSGDSRRVPGGSFLLRVLRGVSRVLRLSTVAPIRGIGGLVVLADLGDERALEVMHEIRGENPEYRVMTSLLGEGDTFVDVGANFGTFSLLASRIVGASGRVIAIEPQPGLAQLVAESIQLSGAANCEVREIACGRESGQAELMVPEDDTGRAGLFAGFSGRAVHEALSVFVSSLDALLRDTECPGIMLIKIDVEGSELAVLDGARDTIASRRPAILIELNPWSAAAAGTSTAEIVDRLAELGYTSFATSSSFPDTVSRSSIPLDRQINLVATQ